MESYKNLAELSSEWVDIPEFHQYIHETFTKYMEDTPKLREHRLWVKSNQFGVGEDSFHWLHKLIVDEMPNGFKFLEVGVFRSQVLSLYKLLADISKKKVVRYGASPMNSSDGHWESDYFSDAVTIHHQFNLKKDYTIYHGSSTDANIIKKAIATEPYDILYIDGSHKYEDVVSDLIHYPQMIKSGGYLLVDDSCNDMKMPWGFFQGIEPVTRAVLDWEKTETGQDFKFVFNVVHLNVYQRK